MSASDQKNMTKRLIRVLVEQYQEVPLNSHQAPLDLIRYHQGVLQGLRLAEAAGDEAYKAVGV